MENFNFNQNFWKMPENSSTHQQIELEFMYSIKTQGLGMQHVIIYYSVLLCIITL